MGRIFRANAGQKGFEMSRRDCLLRRSIYVTKMRDGKMLLSFVSRPLAVRVLVAVRAWVCCFLCGTYTIIRLKQERNLIDPDGIVPGIRVNYTSSSKSSAVRECARVGWLVLSADGRQSRTKMNKTEEEGERRNHFRFWILLRWARPALVRASHDFSVVSLCQLPCGINR